MRMQIQLCFLDNLFHFKPLFQFIGMTDNLSGGVTSQSAEINPRQVSRLKIARKIISIDKRCSQINVEFLNKQI